MTIHSGPKVSVTCPDCKVLLRADRPSDIYAFPATVRISTTSNVPSAVAKSKLPKPIFLACSNPTLENLVVEL